MWDGRSRSTKPPPAMPLARYTASVMTRTSDSRGLSAAGFCADVRSAGRAVDENAIVLPSGAHSGFPAPRGMSVMAHGSPRPPAASPAARTMRICGRLRPAVLLDRSREGQPPTIGRPPRARVANTAGDRARRLAAVRPGEPDRGVIGILLFVDAHAHERDVRSVGRDLRIGHPDEREEVFFRDWPALCRGRCDKPEYREPERRWRERYDASRVVSFWGLTPPNYTGGGDHRHRRGVVGQAGEVQS